MSDLYLAPFIEVARRNPQALKILHCLWAPPNVLCLRAAARRLAELMGLLPGVFASLEHQGLPTRNQLVGWINQLEQSLQAVAQPTEIDKAIEISPIDALNRPSGRVRHPLSGYAMSEFSIYSLLLITPPPDDEGRQGFDRIAAWAAFLGIAEHLNHSSEDYLRFASAFHSYKQRKLPGTSWDDVAPFALAKASRLDNARRAIATLQQSAELSPLIAQAADASSLDGILKVIDQILNSIPLDADGKRSREAAQISSLATLFNERPISEQTRGRTHARTSDEDRSETKKSARTQVTLHAVNSSERIGTYYKLSDLLMDPEAPEDPNDADIAVPLYYLGEDQEDLDDDLPIEELLGQPTAEVTRVDRVEQLDPPTLQAWSQNKLDFARRLAEHQPYGLDYVCLDQRHALVASLCEIRENHSEDLSRIAANLILASLVTGRRWKSLLEGLAENTPEDRRFIIPDSPEGTLRLRLNRPTLKTEPVHSSLKTETWIVAPDHFGLRAYLRSTTPTEELWLLDATEKILSGLAVKHQIKPQQIHQLLPRTMLEREGNFCTASLLTDWNVGNINVDLHYLTPAASFPAQRYVSALESMLEIDGLAVPTQIASHVGHPNTPPVSEVERVIHACNASISGASLLERHNHIVIHTAIMLSLAVGLRSTQNIKPGGIQLLDKNICHFREKGFTRLVCLPELMAEQLIAYEHHMSLLSKVWQQKYGVDRPHENLFFVFDTDNNPEPFRPSKLSNYLQAFGVQTDLEIRGLRRLVFTWLYEHGGFGRTVDHFIGHAVNGSMSFVLHSGVQMSDLRKVANFINDKLNAMNWPIAAGINHRHAAFRH